MAGGVIFDAPVAVVPGARTGLVGRILGTTAHISVTSPLAGKIDNYKEIQRTLLQSPEVETALPYIAGQGLLSHSNMVAGVLVRGIDPNQEKQNPDWRKYVILGDMSTRDGLPGVILGTELAKKLAQRLTGTSTTTYAAHPGGVASDIWQRRMGAFAVLLRPFLITVDEGAKTQLRCATDPALAAESGFYYEKERQKTPSKPAQDEALRDELERRSREWAGAYL